MSGGDGNGPGNTGLGHNGGQPSGNINGTSGAGGGGGGGSTWSGFTASTFHDPISGGLGITLTGTTTGTTSSGTTGGVTSAGSRDPKFIANVGGWAAGSSRGGSLAKPTIEESWTKNPNEVAYMVSFGKEKYRVTRDKNGDTFKSTFVEGGATRKDQLMDDQAIAIAKRYELSKDEKSLLLGTSAIIADTGEKLSSKLSAQYKTLANTIANEIKNFQGKKIRTLDEAMNTLNSVLANPTLKLSAADKTAIVNALKKLNATDMANKLKNLSKGFGVADRALKVESVRSATVIGIETGNWKPLGLEVESMVLSGIAGSIAVAIVSSILALLAVALPATITVAVSYIAIVLIAYTTSLIDKDVADQLNKQVASIFKR